MKPVRICEECQGPLPGNSPEGLCPKCLLKMGAAELGIPARRLETPAGVSRSDTESRRFGCYEILEKIAQGGMGTVYRARQLNLGRIVALKLLPFGAFSRTDLVQRFQSEATAAAALQHPNIVAVHDIGEHEGQPFFSMDFVEGRTLAEVVRDQPLPARRAAGYLKTIAEAVHYAHQQGILHRDLKPSNVLIDAFDQPRVTDFGLAKRLHGDSDLTLTGQVLGSPNFMSPEQAEGHSKAIGAPSDVYSLGALLYHLLTRQPPFQADTLTTLLRQVIENDPVPPRLLNPSIPRDLETICLKCLEKEPQRRYLTAQALAEDLERFLSDQPVMARPLGFPGKTWRSCRRQPLRAALVAAVILLFVAGTTGVLSQWRKARRNEVAEAYARATAEKAAYAARIGLIASLITDRRFDRARELLLGTPESYRGWEWGWLQRQCNQDLMTLRPKAGAFQMSSVFSPDMRLLATAGFEPDVHLWDLPTGLERRLTNGHTGRVGFCDFSPDGHQFASAGWTDGTVCIWKVETGRLLKKLPHPGGVSCTTYSPDGKWLATTCWDGKLRIWDAETGVLTGLSASYGDAIDSISFSPDGRYVAFAGGFFYWADAMDTSIRVWDLQSGNERRLEGSHRGTVKAVWSPKGDRLASAGWDPAVRLWEWPSGRELTAFEQVGRPIVFKLDFSPNGQFLAVAGSDLTGAAKAMARLYDVRTGRLVRELPGHSEAVIDIHFSPDGRFLATASSDCTVKVWPVEPEPASLYLQGHNQPVWAVAWSEDKSKVATGSFDGTAKLWDPRTGALLQDLPAGIPVLSLAFSSNSDRLITPCADNATCIWQVESGSRQVDLRGHSGAVMAVAWSRDDQRVATGSKDRTARIWDPVRGVEILRLAGHTGWVRAISFAPDSKLLATGSSDKTIRLWDMITGRCFQTLSNSSGEVVSLAFSPAGTVLAAGGQGGACLWNLQTGSLATPPLVHGPTHAVTALSFSPDGQRLATAENSLELYMNHAREMQVHLWDTDSGHELYSFAAHTNAVYAVAFGPDGKTLATGGADNTARIWTAFPWRAGDYAGEPGSGLPERIEQYKREFWRKTHLATAGNERIPHPARVLSPKGPFPSRLGEAAAPSTEAAGNQRQKAVPRRIVQHILGDLNLPAAGSKRRPLLPIPLRPTQATSNQVDLTMFYNVALNESWQPVPYMHHVDFNLAAIPPGVRTFDGIDFDIRGLIHLRAASVDFELFPVSVLIPLNRKCQRLHLLHGVRWPIDPGTVIGHFVIHYASGVQTNLPVRYGNDVGRVLREDILGGPPEGTPFEEDIHPAASDWNVRLYHTTFANPHPEREIFSIEYISQVVRCAPLLVALTLDSE